MRLLRLLLLRSIRERPLRFFLAGFGIILGVAGMLAISITNTTALNALAQVFENTSGRTDLSVTLTETSDEGFNENALRLVQSAPGVAAAIPVLRAASALADGDIPDQLGLGMFGANAGGLTLNGIDPALDIRIRNYNITQGRFLLPDPGAAEIVLGENYAADQKIKVGPMGGASDPQWRRAIACGRFDCP